MAIRKFSRVADQQFCSSAQCLTWMPFAFSVKWMGFGRAILVLLVVTALAAYVVDCSGMTTPAEAMNCCQSMPCSSSSHSQQCCETMPQMHAPFVQPPSAHGLSFVPYVFTLISISQESPNSDSAGCRIARSLLAPPGSSPPTAIPIRI
jgi:hypothetical protein